MKSRELEEEKIIKNVDKKLVKERKYELKKMYIKKDIKRRY